MIGPKLNLKFIKIDAAYTTSVHSALLTWSGMFKFCWLLISVGVEAVDYEATVLVNGQVAGHHAGGEHTVIQTKQLLLQLNSTLMLQ